MEKDGFDRDELRLKTTRWIQWKQAAYSLSASWPNAKKTKKMTAEAGNDHQEKYVHRRTNGGMRISGKRPTREKLKWTFCQLIHGLRPLRIVNHMLKTINRTTQNIWTTAIAIRRRYVIVVNAEFESCRCRAKVRRLCRKWWRERPGSETHQLWL